VHAAEALVDVDHVQHGIDGAQLQPPCPQRLESIRRVRVARRGFANRGTRGGAVRWTAPRARPGHIGRLGPARARIAHCRFPDIGSMQIVRVTATAGAAPCLHVSVASSDSLEVVVTLGDSVVGVWYVRSRLRVGDGRGVDVAIAGVGSSFELVRARRDGFDVALAPAMDVVLVHPRRLRISHGPVSFSMASVASPEKAAIGGRLPVRVALWAVAIACLALLVPRALGVIARGSLEEDGHEVEDALAAADEPRAVEICATPIGNGGVGADETPPPSIVPTTRPARAPAAARQARNRGGARRAARGAGGSGGAGADGGCSGGVLDVSIGSFDDLPAYQGDDDGEWGGSFGGGGGGTYVPRGTSGFSFGTLGTNALPCQRVNVVVVPAPDPRPVRPRVTAEPTVHIADLRCDGCDERIVRRHVRSWTGALDDCHRAHPQTSEVGGRFVVLPGGGVADSRSDAHDELSACIAGVVAGVQMSRGDTPFQVEYRLVWR
jgi:hypothetical protein